MVHHTDHRTGRRVTGVLAVTRKFLYVARKAPAQLKSGYKQSTNRVVKGIAKTGEVSPKGLVAETEHWDGRITGEAGPTPIRLIANPDGTLRKMTFAEMVEKGYFIIGQGPPGVRVRRNK